MVKRFLTLALAAVLALSLALPALAAPRIVTGETKDIFRLINKEREAAGLNTLKWDDNLAEAAEIRALECTEKFTSDHNRPNGQSFFSVSTLVTGENTAWNQKSAQATVDAWMSSKGHKENILRDTYTIGAVACAQADDGTIYRVILFGNGKSNASWAGVKTYTLDPFSDTKSSTASSGSDSSQSSAGASTTATSSNTSTKLLDKDGKVTAAGAESELKKAIAAAKNTKDVVVKVQNATSISPAVLKSLAASSAGKTVTIQADTMNYTGKSVQGRMILEPAKLTGRKGDIKLGVFVDSASVKDIKAKMEKQYSNTMAYIHMEHSGTLTASTKVVAKVKLSGLNTKNLQFYVHNSKKDTLTKIETPNYSVDSKGFVTFYTSTAGDIVITDKALSK